jgi:hypothetical protein
MIRLPRKVHNSVAGIPDPCKWGMFNFLHRVFEFEREVESADHLTYEMLRAYRAWKEEQGADKA